MWKTLKVGAVRKYGDQQQQPDTSFAPIPAEDIGKPVSSSDRPIRRWVKPAGPPFRHGEETTRITIRIPVSLRPLIPGPAGTWAADRVIEAIKAGGVV